jgi:hypothetical protein
MKKTFEEAKKWKSPVSASIEINQAILEFAEDEDQAIEISLGQLYFDVIKNRAIEIHKERQERVGSICCLYLSWGRDKIRVQENEL